MSIILESEMSLVKWINEDEFGPIMSSTCCSEKCKSDTYLSAVIVLPLAAVFIITYYEMY